MNFIYLAIVSAILAIIVAFVRTKREKHFAGMYLFQRVFGIWFVISKQIGNCFSPAIVLNWSGRTKAHSSHAPINEQRLASFTPSCQHLMRIRHQEKMARPEVISRAAWGSMTFRFSNKETVIYWRGWFRFDWNSEHIAARYGKKFAAYHGTVFNYKGWLGSHQLV